MTSDKSNNSKSESENKITKSSAASNNESSSRASSASIATQSNDISRAQEPSKSVEQKDSTATKSNGQASSNSQSSSVNQSNSKETSKTDTEGETLGQISHDHDSDDRIAERISYKKKHHIRKRRFYLDALLVLAIEGDGNNSKKDTRKFLEAIGATDPKTIHKIETTPFGRSQKIRLRNHYKKMTNNGAEARAFELVDLMDNALTRKNAGHTLSEQMKEQEHFHPLSRFKMTSTKKKGIKYPFILDNTAYELEHYGRQGYNMRGAEAKLLHNYYQKAKDNPKKREPLHAFHRKLDYFNIDPKDYKDKYMDSDIMHDTLNKYNKEAKNSKNPALYKEVGLYSIVHQKYRNETPQQSIASMGYDIDHVKDSDFYHQKFDGTIKEFQLNRINENENLRKEHSKGDQDKKDTDKEPVKSESFQDKLNKEREANSIKRREKPLMKKGLHGKQLQDRILHDSLKDFESKKGNRKYSPKQLADPLRQYLNDKTYYKLKNRNQNKQPKHNAKTETKTDNKDKGVKPNKESKPNRKQDTEQAINKKKTHAKTNAIPQGRDNASDNHLTPARQKILKKGYDIEAEDSSNPKAYRGLGGLSIKFQKNLGVTPKQSAKLLHTIVYNKASEKDPKRKAAMEQCKQPLKEFTKNRIKEDEEVREQLQKKNAERHPSQHTNRPNQKKRETTKNSSYNRNHASTKTNSLQGTFTEDYKSADNSNSAPNSESQSFSQAPSRGGDELDF